jgi:hypothetical protein
VILDKVVPSLEVSLELRLLYRQQTSDVVSREDVIDRLRKFFMVYVSNEHRVMISFVDELNGFELSKTGRKVIKFVDRSTEPSRSFDQSIRKKYLPVDNQ